MLRCSKGIEGAADTRPAAVVRRGQRARPGRRGLGGGQREPLLYPLENWRITDLAGNWPYEKPNVTVGALLWGQHIQDIQEVGTQVRPTYC